MRNGDRLLIEQLGELFWRRIRSQRRFLHSHRRKRRNRGNRGTQQGNGGRKARRRLWRSLEGTAGRRNTIRIGSVDWPISIVFRIVFRIVFHLFELSLRVEIAQNGDLAFGGMNGIGDARRGIGNGEGNRGIRVVMVETAVFRGEIFGDIASVHVFQEKDEIIAGNDDFVFGGAQRGALEGEEVVFGLGLIR